MQLDLTWLLSILRDRYLALDLFATVAVYGCAVLPLLLRGRYHYDLTLVIPAAILCVLALTMPNKLLGSMFAAVRLIPVACAIAILAVRELVPPPRWVRWLALALFAARLGSITISQLDAQQTARQQLSALDHLAVGSRVISFQVERCGRAWPMPRLWHLASFATTRRDAFVNDQFATAAGQTLSFRDSVPEAVRHLAMQAVLGRGCSKKWSPIGDLLAQVPWNDVDYLWILESDTDVIGARYPVRLIRNDGHTQLYAVMHRPQPETAPRR